MSIPYNTSSQNFLSTFLQGTNIPQPPPYLLVRLRAQPITQDWMTHNYSTGTNYIFNQDKLKDIVSFSQAVSNNSLNSRTQLPEHYLIVLWLYNYYVPTHTKLSLLPLFQDQIQYKRIVQVSQDFVYCKNIALN